MISRRLMMNDEIVSKSGELLQLEKCKGSYFQKFNVYGNTKQASTTGAQLFDISKSTIGVAIDKTNGAEATYGNSWRVSDYIEIKENTNYSANNVENYGNTGFAFYRENKTFISGIACSKLFQTPQGAKYVRLTVYNSLAENFMFNEGTSVKPYEPYTGGKPSPSPEYPQEIKNVGKWNELTGKYEVDVKVTGKNILNLQESDTVFDRCVLQEDGSVRSDIKNYYFSTIKLSQKSVKNIKNGDTITFRVDNFIRNKISILVTIIDNDNRQTVIERNQEGNEVSITIQGAKKIRSIEIRLNRKSAPHTDTTSVFKNLMLCFGNDSVYQPYKEQTLTLTSDRPITKWDKLVEQDGQIGWLYQHNTVILNGSESWGKFGDTATNGLCTTYIPPKSTTGLQTSLIINYINKNSSWNAEYKDTVGIYSDHTTSKARYFRPPNETIQTVEQWKEWLSQNPLTMIYKTENSEFVPLTQSEQDALNALYTYIPNTIITNSSNCEMKVAYRKIR